MLLSFRQSLLFLFISCHLAMLQTRRRSCMLLALLGLSYFVLAFIGPGTMENRSDPRIIKRSIKRSRHPVHITAHEVLDFPQDYHAKGVLSLPYGDIVEPFEAWYSTQHKMSRIDYYGGMDKTYQKELLGKHGFACKIVPEYSESRQRTYRGCLHRRGTKSFPVKAQSIVPTFHYFKYVGDIMIRGHHAAKWQHEFKIYHKVNTYILYTSKIKPVKPLRYEMMGYDTLLSSYYDHYVLDYEMFEPWHFNYTTLQIPTDLDCFDFSSKTFSKSVGELNPMLEFMPHTQNGAPFSFSHAVNGATRLFREESSLSGNEQMKYNSPDYNRGINTHFAYNSPRLFSTDDKTSQTYIYPNVQSETTGRKKISQWQGITKHEENKPNKFQSASKSLQHHFTPTFNINYKLIHSSTSRKLEHLRDKERDKENQLFHNRKAVKRMFDKNLATHFKQYKKRKSKHKRFRNVPYRRGIHGKHSRIRKNFNFRSVRRTNSMKKIKSKLESNVRNNIGWKKSFDVNQMLRQNYEEIVNVLFAAFKVVHKKTYSSLHEYETRKDIYRHNLRFIQSRNRMHLSYKLQSNHLMDLTDDELHRHKGLLGDQNEYSSNGGIPFEPLSDDFPPEVDWRKRGAVNSVRSQGICGSCYAYAATGALEGAFFLKNGYLPDFSEQEIIDCSWGFGNRGCRGGYPHRAMQWILKHGGLAKEDNYGKYLAQEGYCHFKNVSVGVRVDSYMNISKQNSTELKQAISQYGPVSVLINTKPKSFKFYSSGIYYDPECSDSKLDHAALAVGYGKEKDVPYWLIKNSWSKAWGESGYIKIAERNNNCGVTSKAVVVRIK